jgi:hypothetical protein
MTTPETQNSISQKAKKFPQIIVQEQSTTSATLPLEKISGCNHTLHLCVNVLKFSIRFRIGIFNMSEMQKKLSLQNKIPL